MVQGEDVYCGQSHPVNHICQPIWLNNCNMCPARTLVCRKMVNQGLIRDIETYFKIFRFLC